MDHETLIADIASGHYDDHLATIREACIERVGASEKSLRWRIRIDGDTWDEDTITIGEIRFVERTTGINWSELGPLVSADVLTAFVIAHYHKVNGIPLQEAWDKAEALNAKTLIDAVTEYQVDELAPKD